MDATALGGLIASASTLVLILLNQISARSKAQRLELRGRRSLDVLRIRYIADLEEDAARHRRPPLVKPKGLAELEEEDW